MKSTEAKPGKPYVLKLRDDEEELVKEWLNTQDVYSDSIRFLIQKEIAENGIRNLQNFITRTRSIKSIRSQLGVDAPKTASFIAAVPQIPSPPPSGHEMESPTINSPTVTSTIESRSITNQKTDVHNMDSESQSQTIPSKQGQNIDQQTQTRKAGKTFGADVMQSYN